MKINFALCILISLFLLSCKKDCNKNCDGIDKKRIIKE